MPKMITCTDIEGQKHLVSTSDLSWRPSVYAIIVKNKKVLLSNQYGGFDLPGGGVDLGEDLYEALKREVKEETGVNIANPGLIEAKTNFFKLPSAHSHENRFIQSLLLYFTCDFKGGKLSIDGFDEHERLNGDMPEWVSIEDLEKIKVSSSIDWRPLVRKVASQ